MHMNPSVLFLYCFAYMIVHFHPASRALLIVLVLCFFIINVNSTILEHHGEPLKGQVRRRLHDGVVRRA